jgi:hypothetical protein
MILANTEIAKYTFSTYDSKGLKLSQVERNCVSNPNLKFKENSITKDIYCCKNNP